MQKNMETDSRNSGREKFRASRSGRSFAGLVLVIVGGALLSRQLGVDVPYWLFSPGTGLIALGLFLGGRRAFKPGPWLILIMIGGSMLLNAFYPEISIWNYAWPMAIILFGLWMILKPRREKRNWDNWEKWKTEPDSSDNRVEANSVFGG